MIDLYILLASLAGFVALALAMDKHAKHFLRRTLPALACRILRVLGWVLLALALYMNFHARGWSIGSVAWFGWLTIAGAALVFYMPNWPWQPVQPQPARKAREGKPQEGASLEAIRSPWGRRVAVALLVLLPVGFAVAFVNTPLKPTMRDDAYSGRIGPWGFTLAEENHKLPQEAAGSYHKSFYVRFCERCDADIRSAYLKIRKPRSLRAAGSVLGGTRWDRWVEIPIPPAAKLSDQLWLTVEAKDGSLHHKAIDFAQVSPSLARFIESK
ncbi:DUF3325 domain-containing protein [Stutzerimonas kirkiae]|uniref:DUF3325 domain-containing protein n=1 Tax=Stutzerimonas kirkiae TaxID=2211392 RepID=A0A4Q9RE19_9GAMM|nr:DUF3325 domain-containing protein [Stutzerimonas kirkiae]TBU99820.1 DUF3325 domain-containing protein [Stutzerimonas kirkiae]TBV05248.1 DUF3325 domain-containing protein [Stutzerimonas kirkiae]